uniref:Uncharacterized protein n=1 Tax=Trichogramma kaykai TaxID=54128 RepID=A0ABD2XBK8_9HYME
MHSYIPSDESHENFYGEDEAMILVRIEDGDFEGEEMIIDVCDLEDIYSCQELIERLTSMRACVHWEIEEDRRNFLLEICPFISAWESRNLDLQTIFLKEEIELLLVDSLSCLRNRDRSSPGEVFIDFVTKTGYKDEPIIAEDGKILYHRTTPIHCAARSSCRFHIVEKLFAIYDNYQINYTDKTGLSHFQVACKFGCYDVIYKFLELGQNPNCVWGETGDSSLHFALAPENWSYNRTTRMLLERGTDPTLVNAQGVTILHLLCKREPDVRLVDLFLCICAERNHFVQINAQDKFGNTPLHEALKYGQIKWIHYLLKRGARPNLANENGFTPLHVICQRNEDDGLIEIFLKCCDNAKHTVNLNARDKEGRTPLEYAVARLLPRAVDVLLAKVANLSEFVFPTAAHFAEILSLGLLHDYHFKLRIAAGSLSIVEKLESRGFELVRSDALATMELFDKSKVLEKPKNLDERWYEHEKFVSRAKEVMIRKDFSLYDLVELRAKDAAYKLTPRSYYEEFVYQRKLNNIFRIHKEACAIHLCVKLSRKFFHEWAQDPLWKLLHGKMPIECCDMVIENLDNDDLHRILLAPTAQSLKQR